MARARGEHPWREERPLVFGSEEDLPAGPSEFDDLARRPEVHKLLPPASEVHPETEIGSFWDAPAFEASLELWRLQLRDRSVLDRELERMDIRFEEEQLAKHGLDQQERPPRPLWYDRECADYSAERGWKLRYLPELETALPGHYRYGGGWVMVGTPPVAEFTEEFVRADSELTRSDARNRTIKFIQAGVDMIDHLVPDYLSPVPEAAPRDPVYLPNRYELEYLLMTDPDVLEEIEHLGANPDGEAKMSRRVGYDDDGNRKWFPNTYGEYSAYYGNVLLLRKVTAEEPRPVNGAA